MEERPPWEEERPPLSEEPPLPDEPPFFDEPPGEMEYVFDIPDAPAPASKPEPPRMPPSPPQRSEPPRPVPAPRREKKPAPPPNVSTPTAEEGENRMFWPAFAASLQGKVSSMAMPYLKNPDKVVGIWKNGMLTIWVDKKLTQSILDKPETRNALVRAASAAFGCEAKVHITVGRPPAPQSQSAPQPPAPPAQSAGQEDAMNELLAFGAKFDNIIIQ